MYVCMCCTYCQFGGMNVHVCTLYRNGLNGYMVCYGMVWYVVLVRRYKCVLPVLASVDGSSSKVSISAALMSAIQ